MPEKYLKVSVPVTDLRQSPITGSMINRHDPLQESQLLYNEQVLYVDETDGWCRVEAIEQQHISANGIWKGYPGWVRKAHLAPVGSDERLNGTVRVPYTIARIFPSEDAQPVLPFSIGTRFHIDDAEKGFCRITLSGGEKAWIRQEDLSIPDPSSRSTKNRAGVIATAISLLGTPYYWGGRSVPLPWQDGPVMGVDCSALVNLAFRTVNIDLPRDACAQWDCTTPVSPENLAPGDLVFLSQSEEEASTLSIDDCRLMIEKTEQETRAPTRGCVDAWMRESGKARGGSTDVFVEGTPSPKDCATRAPIKQGRKSLRASACEAVEGEASTLSIDDCRLMIEKTEQETIAPTIVHVMIFLGGETFIEAPETGNVVRRCTFKDKFGLDLEAIKKEHCVIHDRSIYFGRVEGIEKLPIREA